MREIVLDTETTGFDTFKDRVIEIGCVEVFNYIPTGKHYHVYINPCRDVPEEAVKVHGLTTEFLADKPLFSEIVDDFLTFIEGSNLVIHNASFDMGFLNAELKRHGFSVLPDDRAVDTLLMARQQFPGSPASLDALCRRFEIDNSSRTYHGALLDAELLAEVYLELRGGREPGLDIKENLSEEDVADLIKNRKKRPFREFPLSDTEKESHIQFLKDITDPVWFKT